MEMLQPQSTLVSYFNPAFNHIKLSSFLRYSGHIFSLTHTDTKVFNLLLLYNSA